MSMERGGEKEMHKWKEAMRMIVYHLKLDDLSFSDVFLFFYERKHNIAK